MVLLMFLKQTQLKKSPLQIEPFYSDELRIYGRLRFVTGKFIQE